MLPDRFSEPRTDLPFLRARPKRNVVPVSTGSTITLEAPQGSQTASNASSGSSPKISFERPDRVKQAPPATPSVSLAPPTAPAPPASNPHTPKRPKMDADLSKHSVPYLRGNRELSIDKPVVRLDFRQSGMGSLSVSGAQAFAWELQDMLAGIKVAGGAGDSTIDPPSYGNRPLVEYYKGDVVIGLRHARELRRLVIASQVSDLRVKLYDNSEVFMPSESGKNVLLISRIGHELELRMEAINSVDILGVFGIRPSQVSR